ncbi:MAG: hypothetical protein PHG23_03495 [Candidatus Pacebacteria bacterium]|nr:hypothetical protein [Candidatus Paceibacterota bacterium]
MSDEVLESLRTGVRKPLDKDKPIVQTAREKVVLDPETGKHIGITAEMMLASLISAGCNVKNGKKQISTQKTTTLPSLMRLKGTFFPFNNMNGDWESSMKPDKRRGRLRDGTAVCIVRPKFSEWEFEVPIEVNDNRVKPATIKALFEEAGGGQGLGAFRPNCRGIFGQFEVVEFAEQK